MIDPSKLTVKEKAVMGMWPPQGLIGVTIAPYIRRMRGDVDVLDIGVGKGENLAYLHEHAPNVQKFYGLSHDGEHEELLTKNMEGLTKIERVYDSKETAVVIVNMNETVTPELLSMYYAKVKPTGYFVGDLHNEVYVKEALAKFRRDEKIGRPIQVFNNVWFWTK